MNVPGEAHGYRTGRRQDTRRQATPLAGIARLRERGKSVATVAGTISGRKTTLALTAASRDSLAKH
jgi:hypothetical protein